MGKPARNRKRFKAQDLKSGVLSIPTWELDDPSISYDATNCFVSRNYSEVEITFGVTTPGRENRKLLNAVTIIFPTSEVRRLLSSFDSIRARLARLEIADPAVANGRISEESLENLTSDTFRRMSAQILRCATGDDVSVLDFYRRPIVPDFVIRSQPNKTIEFSPVIRVICSPAVLKGLLSALAEEVPEATTEEEAS